MFYISSKTKKNKRYYLKNKYSIIQDEINKKINDFIISFPESLKSFLYLAENENFDKTLSVFKELNKNAENFLKVNSLDNIIEREKKIQYQLETIRLNSHAIMNNIKENNFQMNLQKN